MIRRFLLGTLGCLLFSGLSRGQQQTPPASKTLETQQQDDALIPGDWAPELLDAILSSSNPEARESLLDATFAAGPAVVPQLEAALKDDRTAEFAAQSLAFIGGAKPVEILFHLVDDPRDLDLRRFCYGALGEFRNTKATQVLLDALAHADAEPDRTVSEAVILALTVQSDLSLLTPLRETKGKIQDVVIRDDLDNALEVIEARGRYLASPDGKNAGSSIERAVRSYFIPALESPRAPIELPKPAGKNAKPVKSTAAQRPATTPKVSVEIENLILSPDKSRALAHVIFEDPSALANYDIVLQKEFGDWIIASVWLGAEAEKPQATPRLKSLPEN